LLLNPFVLLSVDLNATAQQIKQAHEDAVEDGIAPVDILQRAQQSLLTPKLRVEAEVGGFIDVNPELSKQVIAKLKAGASWSELDDVLSSLHSLPRSNVLAHLGAQSAIGVGKLLKLIDAQATIAVGGVYDAIIEAREQARAGKVDRETVAAALAQLEERQIKAILNTLIGEKAFETTFLTFVERVLAVDEASFVTKLDTYIRVYSHAAAPELSRRRDKVVMACDTLRSHPDNEPAIDRIASALRNWNEIAQPLELFESHMHREDAAGGLLACPGPLSVACE
jgi:hypothetical protein